MDNETLISRSECSRLLADRRSVRSFDPARTVSRDVIERLLEVARNAPSGANCQPFHFLALGNAAAKLTLRDACEAVEQDFYASDATATQRDDLAHLPVHAQKPMLTDAPWVIVISRRIATARERFYYPAQSTWLAAGVLLAAITAEGLSTVPYTPRPTRAIATALGLDETYDPLVIFPVGYPAGAPLPNLTRKPADQTTQIVE
ncbi:MAG: nitroreductase family protein [Phycisphaerales bacterium]|jgi:iodotyrosine deiodinase|nr:nitroreductase family protein [Phycisphaerales bacterium]